MTVKVNLVVLLEFIREVITPAVPKLVIDVHFGA